MRNNEEEPKEYFERNILLVILMTILGLFLDWLSIHWLMQVNPWGTATAVPGLILTLQALWLIVNPYAIIYKDRVEIKQSMIYNREFYFLDARAIDGGSGGLKLVYNDGEMEKLPLTGMRASNKTRFKNRLAQCIEVSVEKRDF